MLWLVKYTVVLCVMTPAYCVSIRRGIETAKQLLKSNNITDLDMCTPERIILLCANQTEGTVCSVRLVNKKTEFKQFDNPCYMDLDNICVSQDNIWTIKNFGPCVINPDIRRYANAIEKTAAENKDSAEYDFSSQWAYDDYGRRVIPTRRNEQNEPAETADAAVEVTSKDDNVTTEEPKKVENVTESTTEPVANETTLVEETTFMEETTPVEVTTPAEEATPVEPELDMPAVERMANGDALNFDDDEIGKILDDAGRIKPILRENQPFPPMGRVKSFDNATLCKKRLKPCPLIYLPVCIHHERDDPNAVQYYYFINRCEAQQWSCYHPEKNLGGKTAASSMRTNFCAQTSYLNYSRYVHAISAWTHYGWLHGPGRFNHMLKPNQRAK